MRNIQKAIEEHKQAVIDYGISEERILGIFLYGSQNYGVDTPESDIDTKAVYIPSLWDAVLNKQRVIKELRLPNGEHCEVMDIRHLVDNFKKQNINFVEVLYTKYCWVNPLYEEEWNENFTSFKESIARYDIPKAVCSIVGQALHTLKQDRYNGKKVANVWRLTEFLEKYVDGEPYEKCIKPSQTTAAAMKLLKQKESIEGEEFQLFLEDKLNKMMAQSLEKTFLYEPSNKVDLIMKEGIMELIKKGEEINE